MKRFLALALSVCLLLSTAAVSMSASADEPLKDQYGNGTVYDYTQAQSPYYESSLQTYQQNGYQNATEMPDPIGIHDAQMTDTAGAAVTPVFGTYSGPDGDTRDGVLWDSGIDTITWQFNVTQAGLYQVQVDYFMDENCQANAVRTLSVDGAVPFQEANNITFRPLWKDSTIDLQRNTLGDEVWPTQVQVQRWVSYNMQDSNALYQYPFAFYFEPGTHSVSLQFNTGSMIVGEFRLAPIDTYPTYAQVAQQYQANGYQPVADTADNNPDPTQIELTCTEKNDQSLRREWDTDPLTVPQRLAARDLNVVGGYRWRKGGQYMTFTFEVKDTGLYKFGMRLIQTWSDGLPAYRQISIDGKVPFQEMLAYSFAYDPNFRTETLHDASGNPYLFYLTAGTHTFTMEVEEAPMRDIMYSINDDMNKLSVIVRNINKIVGPNPDANTDYKLPTVYPSLLDDLSAISASLQAKYDAVNAMATRTPAIAHNFQSIKAQIDLMVRKPDIIAMHVADLTNAITSLGSFYQNIQEMPLMIDSFKFYTPAATWFERPSNFFERAWLTIVSFVVSFTKDYDNVGSVLGSDVQVKDKITVWVAYGTDWADQLKQLADQDFTPQSGILVNINVLPANQLNTGSANALLLSITSGRAPDVAVGTSANTPSELAIRDAAYDLSSFPDFDQIKTRFLDNIFTPFTYYNIATGHEGVYALPDTMNFQVMYYRTDILSELNIPVPDTRIDLYNRTLPRLYQNNMEFFFPMDFNQFLFQYGGAYYTPDGSQSALDSPEAFQAFKECTELYTNYGVPVSADFFTRFRSGEMPIGIANYRLYMLFTAAAPELVGRWAIAPIPGLVKPDGTVDRSEGGLASEASIILNQTTKADSAWEFLKWWTSDATQISFARNIEGLVGTDARWNSANLTAFESLPWNRGDLGVIQQYWKWAQEVPVVLGGYYTGRYINNAWNQVITQGLPVRDAIEYATENINRELLMQQEAYGVNVSQ